MRPGFSSVDPAGHFLSFGHLTEHAAFRLLVNSAILMHLYKLGGGVLRMAEINKSKYENTILYLISHMSDHKIHGKKKLAKLLYYVDFDRFEYNESMEFGDR